MREKLLTEHRYEFLSLKGGGTDLSKSTLVKMPHSWKSHVPAHIIYGDTVKNLCAKYLSKPLKKLRFVRYYCCQLILESIGNVHLNFHCTIARDTSDPVILGPR